MFAGVALGLIAPSGGHVLIINSLSSLVRAKLSASPLDTLLAPIFVVYSRPNGRDDDFH